MTRIAQEYDTVRTPGGHRVALQERPFAKLRRCRENGAQLWMASGEGRQQCVFVSLRRPGFNHEIRLGGNRDKVNLVLTRRREVMHDVTIWTPPLGAFVNRQAIEECRGVGRSVGDATGEAGLLGAE